ncbi:hypothetical protein [Stigmatella erecta]|uniref:hypothetical protein n=1 Tax=Stigmatella erecta TaxID=83460 RepID=UPI001160CEAF|nr:hypothetical protein [Stigmatella erecta]
MEVDRDKPCSTGIEVPDAKGDVTAKTFAQFSVKAMRRALRRKRTPASVGFQGCARQASS